MAIWKQALVAIVLMLVAGFGWLRLDPGASATLARFGLDLPVVMALAAPMRAAVVAWEDAAAALAGRNPWSSRRRAWLP
jgi:hypothetical protein